jgi:hypothetical protein
MGLFLVFCFSCQKDENLSEFDKSKFDLPVFDISRFKSKHYDDITIYINQNSNFQEIIDLILNKNIMFSSHEKHAFKLNDWKLALESKDVMKYIKLRNPSLYIDLSIFTNKIESNYEIMLTEITKNYPEVDRNLMNSHVIKAIDNIVTYDQILDSRTGEDQCILDCKRKKRTCEFTAASQYGATVLGGVTGGGVLGSLAGGIGAGPGMIGGGISGLIGGGFAYFVDLMECSSAMVECAKECAKP